MNAIQNTKKKQPYKRKLTEKRRIQNRVAQQVYREKRKKRQELSERTVEKYKKRQELLERTVETLRPRNEDGARNCHAVSELEPFSPLIFSFGRPTLSLYSPTATSEAYTQDNVENRADLHSTGSIDAFTASKTTIVADEEVVSRTAPTPEHASATSIATSLRHILQQHNGDNVDDWTKVVCAEQPDMRSIMLAGLESLRPQGGGQPHLHTSHLEHFTEPHVPIPKHLPFFTGHIVPHPSGTQYNGISLRRQPRYEMYDQNARKIGLSLEKIRRPDCLSPFNAPLSALNLGDSDSIPPDLRPTPSQMHVVHHPFIDLIPFPWFRDRVITLSALSPPAFDRSQLKRDILNEGLICWKSRARSAGQPWDRRSWEAAPWFLEKWGWLIEEKGQVGEQSMWWRGLRGE